MNAGRRNEAELDFGRFAGLGLRFVITAAVFGLLGWWLDGKFNTAPWLLVAGVLLGSVAAFIGVVRAVPPAQNLHLKPLPPDEPEDDR
jgi:F0F1-type ATP synthase assembly protein I